MAQRVKATLLRHPLCKQAQQGHGRAVTCGAAQRCPTGTGQSPEEGTQWLQGCHLTGAANSQSKARHPAVLGRSGEGREAVSPQCCGLAACC